MSSKQGGVMLNKMGKYLLTYICFGLFLFVAYIIPVEASDLSLSNVGVVTLADNKL
jgi:hypothetical protein